MEDSKFFMGVTASKRISFRIICEETKWKSPKDTDKWTLKNKDQFDKSIALVLADPSARDPNNRRPGHFLCLTN